MAVIPSENSSTSTLEGGDLTDVDKEQPNPLEPISRVSQPAPVRRTSTAGRSQNNPDKEVFDPNLDVNLPYRTLSRNANLDEYLVETRTGTIEGPVEPPSVAQASGGKGGEKHYQLVTFTDDDPENPKNWSKAYKWYCTMVVALTCFVVAFCSSVITADLIGVSKTFDVSLEVSFLTITVFVVGFGVGPMAFAPLSEIFGRRVI
ncbi:hypothetical protein ACHAO4_004430 [Trichoderma viride]